MMMFEADVMSRLNFGGVFVSIYCSASCFILASYPPPVSDPLPAFVCFPLVGLSVFRLCPVIPTSLATFQHSSSHTD